MPRADKDFSPIDPAALETSTFTFDFAAMLGSGEIISTAAPWSMVATHGIDSSPPARLIGSPVVSGTKVLQRIGTCVANELYLITATITTSAGQTLTLYSYCQCLAES